MTLNEALEIVHQLAMQNIIDEEENAEEFDRQSLALDIVGEIKVADADAATDVFANGDLFLVTITERAQ